MISPLAFVIDIDSLFALAGRFDHRPIGINDRFFKETCRLLAPHLEPCRVKNFHQKQDRNAAEPPTEVSGGGRVGNPPGAQRIEISFVVAA